MPKIQQQYLQTNNAALYLDVSPSFLKKNMKKLFLEGLHYFKLTDCRLTRWDTTALDEWIQGQVIALSPENSLILAQLISA